MTAKIIAPPLTQTPEQRENMQEWIEALESGRYRKGKYSMIARDAPGWCFCALGVACLMAELEQDWLPGTGHYTFKFPYGDEGEANYESALPREGWTEDRFGFSAIEPIAEIDGHAADLAAMNDFIDLSFPQIAAVLRAWIEGEKEVEI